MVNLRLNEQQVKQVRNLIRTKKKEAAKSLRDGIVEGMRLFEGQIIKKQMTGRPGLKRRTGNLARSWFIKEKKGLRTYAIALGTRTVYARIHQFGGIIRAKREKFLTFKIGKKQWVKKKEVKIPKRLWILEEFERVGPDILKKAAFYRLAKDFTVFT